MSLNGVKLSDTVDYLTNNMDALDALFKEFEYQGFEPTYTFEQMKKNFVKNYGTDKEKLKNLNNDFNKMLIEMAAWIVERGTQTKTDSKTMGRTSEAGRKKVLAFVAAFNVIRNQPKTREDVTMGRIAGVLCYQIATIIKSKGSDARIVGERGNLPAYLAFPSGAALIPSESASVFEDWKKWQASFSTVIGSKSTADQLETYANAIWNSKLYNDQARKKIMGVLSN